MEFQENATPSANDLPRAPNEIWARYMSLQLSVIIPLVQALIGGFFIGIAASVGFSFLDFMTVPAKSGFFVGVCTSTFLWFMLRSAWNWKLEQLLNVDINRDGHIGTPKKSEPIHVPLETSTPLRITADSGEDWVTLPVNHEKLVEACRILNREKFTHASLAGPGKVFTRDEYEAFRASMCHPRNNFARRLPNDRVELTQRGKALVKIVLSRAETEETNYGAK